MKLIASFVSLTLVAALSAWLYLGQGTTDVETAGVQIGASNSTDGTNSGPAHPGEPIASDDPAFSDNYAAAFVGLQAVLDVWHSQPRDVLLANPDALNTLFAEARADAGAEIAALEKKAKEEAAAKEAAAEKKAQEEAAAQKKAEEEAAAEKARQEAAQPPRAVSPPPVSPPPVSPPPATPPRATPPGADCEWDDGEWDCDDDDWDDDDDDDDGDDDDDDD